MAEVGEHRRVPARPAVEGTTADLPAVVAVSVTPPTTHRLPFRLGHHPAFDGIRGYGLVLVVCAHIALHLWPGARTWLFPPHAYMALDVFFVLSGFLITSLLLSTFDRHGNVELRDFLWRRAVRILPALVLLLGALLAASFLRYGPYTPGEWLVDDIFMLSFVSNWFPLDHLPLEMSHTWSLAIEGQFYVGWSLVAAVVLATVRWRPRQVLFGVAAVVVAAIAITRATRLAGGTPSLGLYLDTTAQMDHPLVGAMAGVAYASGWLQRLSRRMVVGLAGAGVVGLLVMPVALDHSDNPWLFSGAATLESLFGALLVVGAVLLPKTGLLNKVLGFRPLVWVGTISYAVYLWHLPIFVVVSRDFDHLPIGLQVGGAVSASVLVGWLSYRYMERPLMTRATAKARRTRTAAWVGQASAAGSSSSIR